MARVGTNPAKSQNGLNSDSLIRIIMPIYIPHFEGYFKDSLDILKISLESIILDKTDEIAITVILNGCCSEVVNYCLDLHKNGYIDDVLISKQNIGKVNAILKGVAGNNSEIFLITDSDVFFREDFVRPLLRIFQHPKVGFVGLQPVFGKASYFTSWTRLFWLTKIKKIEATSSDRFENHQFLSSTGKVEIPLLEKVYSLKIMGEECVLGSGHFCFAVHRSFLYELPDLFCKNYISRGSERKFIDAPSYFTSLMRVSLRKSKAMHLGNVKEKWMLQELVNKRKTRSKESAKMYGITIPNRRKRVFPKLILRVVEKVF